MDVATAAISPMKPRLILRKLWFAIVPTARRYQAPPFGRSCLLAKILLSCCPASSRRARAGPRGHNPSPPECGTPNPKVHVIRIGTARQRDQLVPKLQLLCRSSQRWLSDLGSIPKLEKQPAFAQKGAVEVIE